MPDDFITIVSGLPRSGTSMMMRVLEAAGIPPLTDRVRAADIDNPHGYYEYEPVKRTKQDPSWLGGARGRAVKMVHLLIPDLPPGYDYRILLMERDPEEVVASQAAMLARSGKQGAPPDVLKKVYATQLQAVRAWMSAQPHVRSLDVSYNRVVAAPEQELGPVASFLGRPGSAAAMVGAVDPTLYRNRAQGR